MFRLELVRGKTGKRKEWLFPYPMIHVLGVLAQTVVLARGVEQDGEQGAHAPAVLPGRDKEAPS
jgi:hypothetical protein